MREPDGLFGLGGAGAGGAGAAPRALSFVREPLQRHPLPCTTHAGPAVLYEEPCVAFVKLSVGAVDLGLAGRHAAPGQVLRHVSSLLLGGAEALEMRRALEARRSSAAGGASSGGGGSGTGSAGGAAAAGGGGAAAEWQAGTDRRGSWTLRRARRGGGSPSTSPSSSSDDEEEEEAAEDEDAAAAAAGSTAGDAAADDPAARVARAVRGAPLFLTARVRLGHGEWRSLGPAAVGADGVARVRQAAVFAVLRPFADATAHFELELHRGRGGAARLMLTFSYSLLQLLLRSPPQPAVFEEWRLLRKDALPGARVPLPGLPESFLDATAALADADCRAALYGVPALAPEAVAAVVAERERRRRARAEAAAAAKAFAEAEAALAGAAPDVAAAGGDDHSGKRHLGLRRRLVGVVRRKTSGDGSSGGGGGNGAAAADDDDALSDFGACEDDSSDDDVIVSSTVRRALPAPSGAGAPASMDTAVVLKGGAAAATNGGSSGGGSSLGGGGKLVRAGPATRRGAGVHFKELEAKLDAGLQHAAAAAEQKLQRAANKAVDLLPAPVARKVRGSSMLRRLFPGASKRVLAFGELRVPTQRHMAVGFELPPEEEDGEEEKFEDAQQGVARLDSIEEGGGGGGDSGDGDVFQDADDGSGGAPSSSPLPLSTSPSGAAAATPTPSRDAESALERALQRHPNLAVTAAPGFGALAVLELVVQRVHLDRCSAGACGLVVRCGPHWASVGEAAVPLTVGAGGGAGGGGGGSRAAPDIGESSSSRRGASMAAAAAAAVAAADGQGPLGSADSIDSAGAGPSGAFQPSSSLKAAGSLAAPSVASSAPSADDGRRRPLQLLFPVYATHASFDLVATSRGGGIAGRLTFRVTGVAPLIGRHYVKTLALYR